ncbi:MAG: hypothetical protein PHS04_11105, partial [Tissierellia bacterium]|nr:hypothetical protein [Tissierellia bacterium]
MKSTKLTLLSLILVIFSGYSQNSSTLIPLKNIKLSPSGIEQPISGIENIVDGRRDSDADIFHT